VHFNDARRLLELPALQYNLDWT